MTASQRDQFYKFGCVSRCIIQLAQWHSKPITHDEFVARFYPKYQHWAQFCGQLSVSDIIDICRDLKIGRHSNSYRDIAVIRDILKEGKTSGVFLLSEREFGTEKPNYHCCLIGYFNQQFQVWNPASNGNAVEMFLDEQQVRDLLDKWLGHFLVLRCDR